MKKTLFTLQTLQRHWVGDGFPVRTVFSYTDHGKELSPFLLLDFAGPEEFEPTEKRRGVGAHPHRGFETVTIVYDGEVEHRDSSGAGGKIGPGDVQWMTAASGLIHEEKHGADFAKSGGLFHMIQLWVNLPKKDKMTKPKYQEILNSQIPSVLLSRGAGKVRVIAGKFQEKNGPASTFSPINLWDVTLQKGAKQTFSVPESFTTAVLVLSGRLKVSGGEDLGEADLAVLEIQGTQFELSTADGAKALILNGQPLNEPIYGHGPFVMNTPDEIEQAFADYRKGALGKLS